MNLRKIGVARLIGLLRLIGLVSLCGVAACAARTPAIDPTASAQADEAPTHAGKAPTHAGEAPTDDGKPAFDAIFEDVMVRYQLPGLALGVVRDGKVIYARSAGEIVAGSGQPISPDTLFKIASNSKAMTTGVMARLVDSGKLRWDDPVTRYLPAFRMYDPWVTREMQVRDLLIHNSGLREGAGDLMLWPEPNLFTRADIIAGLAHLKPLHSFRSRYAYDNLLYVVAGEVAAAAAGTSYEELVRRELFEPVGLTRCQVGAFRRDEIGNVAQPHMRQGDRNVPTRTDAKLIPLSTSAAAGGIRCSLNDMLTWMRVWLDPETRSTVTGKPWLSREQRDVLWTAHMPLPVSSRQRKWDGTLFAAYGYGWRLSDVDGERRLSHTGTLLGMYSAVNLLPERRAGFVFMTNGEGSQARIVLNSILAKQLMVPDRALTVAAYAAELESEKQKEPIEQRAPDVSNRSAVASADLARWLGVYLDPWFGEVSLCERDGGVRFVAAKSPQMAGQVMRVGERWLVDWTEASVDAEGWLELERDAADNGAVTMTMSKVDPDADFSYDYEDLRFARVRGCPAPTRGRNVDVEIDHLMRAYDGSGPGASVLVIRDGTRAFRRSYGMANLEERVVATPATNYRLASVTKQFTAASILLLAEDGRLRLDDPVRRWLPTLPAAADPITIRHLLTHTSGLIDYEDLMEAGTTVQVHDADVLRLLESQDRTYFKPDTDYRYSNSGYALLALIVERASGKSFATFLRESIFMPLGMNATVAHERGISTVANRAFGYTETKGAWGRTDQSSTSAVLGDGGIYSSVDDLAKWDAALYDDRLLSAKSRQLAFSARTHTDDPDVEYGFGWRITGETLWHSGETVGFRNVIVRYPRRHMTVIVLTNRNDPEPYRTALAIADLFLPR